MQQVDVAIVGGGPAGCSAAQAAASAGADAIVFEKGVPRADRTGPGPDSTDAAGILDYWLEIMDIPFEEIPDELIYQELDRAEFIGPTERVVLKETTIDAAYDHFGFTYNRAAFDDWLRERAEQAGATYRVGESVVTVETDLEGTPTHQIKLGSGETYQADNLILADGPQRAVTLSVLDQFLENQSASDVLNTTRVNHIAYQEYRRVPSELFESDAIKFWWGYIPGHTAYPWIFPNDDPVARIGLTMPIGIDLSTVIKPDQYVLLRSEDETLPSGAEFIERLLETVYPEYNLSDFPKVTDRGKRKGTETYPISSTRPIDSPTAANVAVTGGAMGATSAFHEGGGHVAIRTGSIAGRLAARERLDQYNQAWKNAIGLEVRRNISMADVVRDFSPPDWDRTFRISNRLLGAGDDTISMVRGVRAGGFAGLKLAAEYRWGNFKYRNDRIVQLHESEYEI